MKTNVTRLPVTKPIPGIKTLSRKSRAKVRNQLVTASAIGLVAITLTGLSLNHLASGITEITGSGTYQAWAMAVGVDLAFVSLELAQLTITSTLRAKLVNYFRPAIVGTLGWSAILNALAFAEHANTPTMGALAVALGLSIPGLVYILTKIGAAIYLATD